MKPRDRKLAVLRQLTQETAPISLSELLEKLPDTYRSRSVLRWLNQLIQEGLVEKTGHTKNAKYQTIKGQPTLQEKTYSYFGTGSLKALRYIKRSLFERTPISYNENWLDSYEPNTTFYLPLTIREQLHQAGRHDGEHDPAGTYAHQIFNRLLIDLSYNSSRLEGNTYSLLDTERLLLHGDSAEGKLDEEKIMILNHKEAIRYLVDSAPRLAVNSKVIFTLHYLLSDGLVEPQYAGKVRDHAVRIGGSTYIPFEDPRLLENHLVQVGARAAAIEDPFEQSLFLLVHISYLQAFTDGNKRTARLSANIPLITHNLVPLSFSDIERDAYMSAVIAIYELQDVRPMVDIYTYSYLRTCVSYEATVKSMGFDEIRVRYRSQRREIIRKIILSVVTGPTLDQFIQNQTNLLIPEVDRKAVMADVLEDLEHIDHNRIAGLGISPEELDEWIKAR